MVCPIIFGNTKATRTFLPNFDLWANLWARAAFRTKMPKNPLKIGFEAVWRQISTQNSGHFRAYFQADFWQTFGHLHIEGRLRHKIIVFGGSDLPDSA